MSAGIGYRNTFWNDWKKQWDNTSYDVESTNHTIIEGDITIPKISSKIGFNIQQESGSLSKLRQYAGYIGFAGLSLKTEKGKFAGSAKFSGLVSSEQSANITFDQVYTYTELSFNMSDLFKQLNVNNNNDFHYIGIRYTKWKLPVEVLLTQESRAFSVIDADFETSFYSFILGEDSFTEKLLYDSSNWKPGWGMIRSYVLGVGYGSCKIGDKAERAAKSLYNISMTDKEYLILAGYVTGQIGPMFGFALGSLKFEIGIAYDVNFLFLGKSPFTDFGSTTGDQHPANDSGKADAGTYPMFLYHGPILRAHGTF